MSNLTADLTDAEIQAFLDDPVLWAHTYLQSPINPEEPLRLRWYQKRVLRDMSQRRVLRMGRRCMIATDVVTTEWGKVDVKTLAGVKENERPGLLTMREDLSFYYTNDYDIVLEEEKAPETVTIQIQTGQKHTVTPDHSFMVLRGAEYDFVPADEIELGDYIGVYVDGMLDYTRVTSVFTENFSQDVYHIELGGTHIFVGDDMIHHNTGKTAVLAVIALFNAHTYGNRQVLVTAAYDSQVQEIFEQMIRMGTTSELFAPSIEGTRQRPFEIKFRNRSIIRGLVANNTVRSKCLPSGSQVMLEGMIFRPIEKLEPGQLVYSINELTGERELKPIKHLHDNGTDAVFELETSSGRRIRATAKHKFYKPGEGWVPLEEFKTIQEVNDKADFIALYPLSGGIRWGRIQSIRLIGQMKVWDLEVEDNHNYVAFWPEDDPAKSPWSVKLPDNRGGYREPLVDGGFLVHNSAHLLIMDETDYMDPTSLIEAVWPVATTFRDTQVVMSSTPSGRREFFWKVCNNLKEYHFNEHHYPSSCSPEWTDHQEKFARATTTRAQYQHEYEAEFGEMAEGVFKHHYVDLALYAYSYDDLVYNHANYYTLGVDWNEAANGVQGIILEWLNEPAQMFPYDVKEAQIAKEPIDVMNKWRIFRSFEIDAVDMTNVTAVNEVLRQMMGARPHYSCFDRGHGYTNYELLRLAIQRKKTASGMKVNLPASILEQMESVDFSANYEIIDPTTNAVSKSRTKNVLVRNTVNRLEDQLLCIPAVDLNNNIVENDQYRLIGQMRDYSVERVGDRGAEVYSKGNDHRLDALMLALHGYLVNKDLFMHWQSSVGGIFVPDTLSPTSHTVSLHTGHNKREPQVIGKGVTSDGLRYNSLGKYPYPGDPPDAEDLKPQRGGTARAPRANIRRRGSRRI